MRKHLEPCTSLSLDLDTLAFLSNPFEECLVSEADCCFCLSLRKSSLVKRTFEEDPSVSDVEGSVVVVVVLVEEVDVVVVGVVVVVVLVVVVVDVFGFVV